MAAAVAPEVEALARLAVEEPATGNVADKTQKNLFAARRVTSSSGRCGPSAWSPPRGSPHRARSPNRFGVVAAITRPRTRPPRD